MRTSKKNGRPPQKNKKNGRRSQKIKWKTNQSTKINLIGYDTITNYPIEIQMFKFLIFIFATFCVLKGSESSSSSVRGRGTGEIFPVIFLSPYFWELFSFLVLEFV
jgi:hypothetical protein